MNAPSRPGTSSEADRALRYLTLLLLVLLSACTSSLPPARDASNEDRPERIDRVPDEPFRARVVLGQARRGPEISVVVTNVTDQRWEMARGCFVIAHVVIHRDSRPPRRNKSRRVLPPKRKSYVLEAPPEYFHPFDPWETQREGLTSFDPWVEIESAKLRAPCH